MPKVKSKKIVRKRFKLSKNGKVMRETQGKRHLRRNKSQSQKRRQDSGKIVTVRKYEKKIKGYLQV